MMTPEDALQRAKIIKAEFNPADRPQALIDLLLPVHQALFAQKIINREIMDALAGAMHQSKKPADKTRIERLYAEAYAAFPDNTYLIARYADHCLRKKGRTPESHQLLDSAIEKHGLKYDLASVKANVWEDQGNYNAAIDLLKKYCETPDIIGGNFLFRLAILYDKVGDFENAVRTQQKAVKPTSSAAEKGILADYLVKLGLCIYKTDPRRCTSLYQQALTLYTGANIAKDSIRIEFLEAAKADPYYEAGFTYDPEKSLEKNIKRIKNSPVKPHPPTKAKTAHDKLVEKAQTLHEQGKDLEALEIYEYLFENYRQQHLDTFLEAGSICQELRDFKKALKYYDFGLALYPDDPLLLDGKAKCLFKLNRKSEAGRLIEKAYALAPDNPKVASTYAKSLCLHGETEKTEQIIGLFVKKIRQNPASVPPSEKRIFIALDLALNPEEPKSDPVLEKIFNERSIEYVLRQARYIRSCNLKARISKSESPIERLRLGKILATNTPIENPQPPANEI